MILVVCGFWGLFCFGLPGSHYLYLLLWGLGWALVWFSGLFVLVNGVPACLLVGVSCLLVLFGEFDPGSGRTLAACLTHASRTVKGPAFVGLG